MDIAEEKQAQRTSGKAARRALSPEQRAAANAALCARLWQLDAVQNAQTILLYAAFGGEAGLAGFAAEAARPCAPGREGGMERGYFLAEPKNGNGKDRLPRKKGCPARGIHRQSGTGYFDFFRHSLHSLSCRERMPPHCGQV